ncbi:hypothetical protein SAMN04488557_3663 [Hyphomicrobium facile]|uniref:Uncharacterized protein n=1 Tax=Hyphomicrobium facile TaxID=51670 RepID=A0A1I7NUU4_9HYPH|nr:hypothetical protein SAMN04488557_3663 [Hyphomicrobium facile]
MATHQNFRSYPERERKNFGLTLAIICLMTLAWVVFALFH